MDQQGRELTFFHSGDFLRQNPDLSDRLTDNSVDRGKSNVKEVDFFSSDRTDNLPLDQEMKDGSKSAIVDSVVNVRFQYSSRFSPFSIFILFLFIY